LCAQHCESEVKEHQRILGRNQVILGFIGYCVVSGSYLNNIRPRESFMWEAGKGMK
jgi:hypothetical protein